MNYQGLFEILRRDFFSDKGLLTYKNNNNEKPKQL